MFWLRGLSALVVAASPGLSGGESTAALSLVFGAIVGFSLGLTGGGGSLFAVPLLVYGLGMAPRQAIGVSLAAVGATALVGVLQRLRRGEVEVPTGLLFAGSGMLGAPVGAGIGGRVPEDALLVLFAALMIVVALRMWRHASRRPEEAHAVLRASFEPAPVDERGPTCRRDPSGRLRMTSRCAALLALVGLAMGVLSGLFGVGGGFVIVPALVVFSGMGIHHAVATSLLVVALVSASGVSAFLASGRDLPLDVTGLFIGGGIVGLALGTVVGRRLSGPLLQKLFALAILAVAAFVTVRSFV